MRNSKIYLVLILTWFLSAQLMSQCIVDVEKQVTDSEVCITIEVDFDIGTAEKIIISDGETNEAICVVNSQAVTWCYQRQSATEEKHIELYAVIAGQVHPIVPNYTQGSSKIVIVDGM